MYKYIGENFIKQVENLSFDFCSENFENLTYIRLILADLKNI